jgi:hypothetical protein
VTVANVTSEIIKIETQPWIILAPPFVDDSAMIIKASSALFAMLALFA